MPRLLPADVHTDRYLTNVGLAWMNDADNYIASKIAPVIKVTNESDKYPTWTKADFFRNEAKKIAAGDPAPRGGFTVSSDTYSCDEVAIANVLPARLIRNADSAYKVQTMATRWTTDQLLLKREIDAATEIFSATNYTNTAAVGTQWSNAAATPVSDMLAAMDLVEDQTGGLRANTIVMGAEVWRELVDHSQVLTFVYGPGADRAMPITPKLLENYFSNVVGTPVRIFVGRGVYNTSAENATASYSKIWGKNCWIAHVTTTPAAMVPSAAYTFQANYEVRKWYEQHTKNTVVEARELRDIKPVSADCAYYYTSAVA
ncbi:hypothetical protein GF319_15920 [Candidatus Bathyarchaeota archaeon]|nr:hypothetical protein [Candidatus Bathyarchaeota archaeon]